MTHTASTRERPWTYRSVVFAGSELRPKAVLPLLGLARIRLTDVHQNGDHWVAKVSYPNRDCEHEGCRKVFLLFEPSKTQVLLAALALSAWVSPPRPLISCTDRLWS